MQRATKVIEPLNMGDNAIVRHVITLTRDARYRRRIVMETDNGMEFLLDLAESAYLSDGCGLQLEDGDIVAVAAAKEPLLEISAQTREQLLKITWHIGNRHTPAEITAEAVYIQPDHVLAEMVRGLGGTVINVDRPFEPEGGAYGHHGSLHEAHRHHSQASSGTVSTKHNHG